MNYMTRDVAASKVPFHQLNLFYEIVGKLMRTHKFDANKFIVEERKLDTRVEVYCPKGRQFVFTLDNGALERERESTFTKGPTTLEPDRTPNAPREQYNSWYTGY